MKVEVKVKAKENAAVKADTKVKAGTKAAKGLSSLVVMPRR
jgi:hypothetical protein